MTGKSKAGGFPIINDESPSGTEGGYTYGMPGKCVVVCFRGMPVWIGLVSVRCVVVYHHSGDTCGDAVL